MHQHSHTETNQASVRSTYFPLSLSLYLGFALGLACILATPPFPPARPGTRAVTYTYNYTLQMGGAAGTRDMKRAAGARQVWRSMALKYYLPSFARVRLTVAVLVSLHTHTHVRSTHTYTCTYIHMYTCVPRF